MTVAILLFPNSVVQAETASSDLTLKVGEVISLTISSPCDSSTYTGNDVTISLTPKNTGVFSSCPNIVTVGTNTTGFQLLFKTSSVNLVNTTASSYTIPSSTNTTPNKLVVNTWGYAIPTTSSANHDVIGIPSTVLSVFDSTYTTRTDSNPIPADKYAKTPLTDSIIKQVDNTITNPTLQNNQTTIFYAAATDLTTRSGTYKTAITYTAIGEEIPDPVYPEILAIVPNIASTITPSGNGTGSNGPQFSITGSNFGANPTVTIGGQPCTEITVSSAGTALTCTGPTTNLTTGDKSVAVANGPVWSNKDNTVVYSSTNYPTLQSLTIASCSATPTIYRDARDSQLYYIAKLLDNKCWMLDNLKYKPNGDTTGTVASSFSATQVANTGTANHLTQEGTIWSTPPNLDSAKYIDPIASAYTLNPSFCHDNTRKPTYNITKCGLLYNYYTATAGSYKQADFTTRGSLASGSICPTSWRLPSGQNAAGDFGALDRAYGGTGADQSGTPAQLSTLWLYMGAFAGVTSGNYHSSFGEQGSDGRFWSSSAFSETSAYYLRFYSSRVYPGVSNVARSFGYAVRCVIGP
jgi:uncharacterized protein (TIGR02145 family)